MASTETLSVQRELQIDASPETVWEFLVDPEKTVRWMGDSAELDPQPGGIYRVRVLPGNIARGEFVEVDPPHRLVLSWGWEETRPGSAVEPGAFGTVEFDLEPNGGGTLLRFTHRDLPSSEGAASHGEGWDHYLGRLATVASGGDPGRDNWLEEMS